MPRNNSRFPMGPRPQRVSRGGFDRRHRVGMHGAVRIYYSVSALLKNRYQHVVFLSFLAQGQAKGKVLTGKCRVPIRRRVQSN